MIAMKKKFFKIISVMLVLAALASLCGCSEKKAAEASFRAMLDTFKEGDYYEALSAYALKNDDSYDFLYAEGDFSAEAYPAYDMHMAVFESLEYKIKKSEIVSETEIHFVTEISTIDLVPVGEELAQMTAAYNISSENAEEDEKLSDSEINDILTRQMVSISSEYLKNEDIAARKTEVETVMYYDVKNGWLVYIDEALADALSGGVYEAYYAALEDADMVTK